MVTSVNTNVNAMAAIQSLDMISSQMTSTQSAIETGLKVNQASDSPAVFTIAQGMRANSDALMAVGDSLTAGIAQVQSAANAATSISNQLSTLLQTVTQGESLTDPNSIAAVNAQITNALSNIDAYAKDSTLNGVNLLASITGTAHSLNVVNDVAGDTTSVAGTDSTSSGLGLGGLSLSTAGATLASTGAAFTAGDTVTVTSGGNTTTFEFNAGAQLNTLPSATNKVVAVNMDDSNGNALTNSQLIGSLVTAMQSNGVNASEDNSGTITVNGGTVAGTSTGLTITTPAPNTKDAIAAVNAAIGTIGTTLSTLGAAAIQLQGLSDYTTQLSDSVTTSLGSLVDANLSAESAQLSSLQTKQSLAIQSLTLANQAPSALLSLFR